MKTMDPELKTKLFATIRSGMGISDLCNSISVDEMKALCDIAKAQSILPIIVRGIKRSTNQTIRIPPEYEKSYLRDTYRAVQFQDVLKRITTILNENAIPYLLLKGAVLRDLYPDAYMRTSCDLDVLVHDYDLDRTVSAITSRTDFKVIARGYHDVAMINPQMRLELHFSLKESMERIDALLDKVWDFAISPTKGYQFTMSTEFQIFHTLAHMSYHLTHGGVGIRPLIDLWLLEHKTVYDRRTLETMLVNTGTVTLYEKCLRLVEAWMSHRKTDSDLLELEDFCLSAGVFGDGEKAALAQVRNQSKTMYVYNRIVAPRSYLEELYPRLKRKPILLPIYQIKRWFRLFDRHRRERARKEFDYAINASQKDKETLDKLLKSLDL